MNCGGRSDAQERDDFGIQQSCCEQSTKLPDSYVE